MLTASLLRRTNVRHYAKFRADRSNRCGHMTIFNFLRWQPFAILNCFTYIWTTHEEHLVVFVTVQNSVGIGAVVSIICQFICFASLAWKCVFTPPLCGFWGFDPLDGSWGTISTKRPKVTYTVITVLTVHYACRPIYAVVPAKLHGQKGVTKKMKRKMNFGAFSKCLLKITRKWLIATFLICMCSICGGQHTDTNNLIHPTFPCFSRGRQNLTLIAILKAILKSISFNSWLRCYRIV